MRITRTSSVPREAGETEHFAGVVERRNLGGLERPEAGTFVVSFQPGARTHWHRHRDGQVIYVLDGVGRVGVRDEPPAVIEPGDVVYASAGEEHWHGAAPDHSMSHVALSFGPTEWLEEATN